MAESNKCAVNSKTATFVWHSFASDDVNWESYKKYDGQKCIIKHYPDFEGENYLIQFEDGIELCVESYEIILD